MRGLSEQAEGLEDLLHRLHLRVVRRVGGVDDVQEQVGVVQLLERGAEGGDQILRQVADEADGVGDDDLALLGEAQAAAGGVERGEELVLDEHVGCR